MKFRAMNKPTQELVKYAYLVPTTNTNTTHTQNKRGQKVKLKIKMDNQTLKRALAVIPRRFPIA